jgi:hypothetical protein
MLSSEIESISIKRKSSKFMTKRRSKRLKAQMLLAVMNELKGEDDKNPKYIFSKFLKKKVFKNEDTGLGRFFGGFLTGLTPSNLVKLLETFFDLSPSVNRENEDDDSEDEKIANNDKENEGKCVFSKIYYALSDDTNKVTDVGLIVYKTNENKDEEKQVDELCEQKDEIIKKLKPQLELHELAYKQFQEDFITHKNDISKKKSEIVYPKKVKLEEIMARLKKCPSGIEDFFMKIKKFFKTVWNKFKTQIKRISNYFVPVYSKVKNGIIAVKKYFDCLVNGKFVKKLLKKLELFGTYVSNLFDKLFSIKSIVSVIKSFFMSLSKEVFKIGQLVYEVVTASLNGKWMEFKEKIGFLLGLIVKFFLSSFINYEELVNGITELFKLPIIKDLSNSKKNCEKEIKNCGNKDKEFDRDEVEEYEDGVYLRIDYDAIGEDSVEGPSDGDYTFDYTKEEEIENEYLRTKIEGLGNTKGEYHKSFVSHDSMHDTVVPERSIS